MCSHATFARTVSCTADADAWESIGLDQWVLEMWYVSVSRFLYNMFAHVVSEKKPLIEIYDQGALIHVGQLIVLFVKRRSPVNMQ